MTVLLALTTVAVLGALTYHRATYTTTLTTVGVLTIVVILFESLEHWLSISLALLTGLVFLIGLDGLRQRIVTEPLLAWFRRTLPALSDTEQAALDAGTVWWDAELFSGRPNWHRLLGAPKPTLTTEEQAFLDGSVNTLCDMLDPWQIDQDGDLPAEVWSFLKDRGFFGMIIEKRYGGLGFSPIANSEVVMKIATRNVTAAVTVMVPNSLGPGELLQHYGTEAQKQHYLPRLASGADIPCFALTSPVAGSDAGSMIDTGVVCRGTWQGEEVLGFRLNWNKRYITLAPVATLLGLAFKAIDPDGLLGDDVELGITCALVPTDLDGVTAGRRHKPSGASFMNGPTQGQDVFVPLDAVIGGRACIGQGWAMLVQSLAAGRAISLPAMGIAGTKLAAHATGAYARIRRQFKMPIGYFEGVEEVLSSLAGRAYRDDATRLLTLTALRVGERPSVLTAIAKAYLTNSNRHAINDAMDVHGGKGIMQGPRNYLQSAYQVLPIGITVEGANILTRSMIVFGQGAIRAHPFILREMQSAQADDSPESLNEFDEAFFGHVQFTLSNFVRTLWMGLTGARWVGAPIDGPTAHYYRQLTRMSSAFALTSDLVLMVLGGNFKFREKLSGRLADALAHMYMASAVLKHFENAGRPEEDLPLVNWAMRDSLHKIQTALINVIRNFPVWWLRRPLKMVIFPLGLFYREPSDNLGKRAARILLSPNDARDRLTRGMYEPQSGTGIAELNDAFKKVVAASNADKRLRAITREVTTPGNYEALIEAGLESGEFRQSEAALVRAAQQAVQRVIDVDDFPAAQTAAEPTIEAHGEQSAAVEAFSTSAATTAPVFATGDLLAGDTPPRPETPQVKATPQPAAVPAPAATSTLERAMARQSAPSAQVATPTVGPTPADDLKTIKGIGPKIAGQLQELGFDTFESIANLNASDIQTIEAQLSFKGRIAREQWVSQAVELLKNKR